jgi:hypothetical protein
MSHLSFFLLLFIAVKVFPHPVVKENNGMIAFLYPHGHQSIDKAVNKVVQLTPGNFFSPQMVAFLWDYI